MKRVVQLAVHTGPVWAVLGIALLGYQTKWSAVLCGFGALGLILFVAIPPSPILVPYVAKRLTQISVPGIFLWTFALAIVGESFDFLLLAAKLVMMTLGPIAVLSKWSVHEVIVLGELIGLRSYAHTIPASIQHTVLSGPAWIGEANEISKTLRSSGSLGRGISRRVSLAQNVADLLLLFAVESILDFGNPKQRSSCVTTRLLADIAPIAPSRLAFLLFLGVSSFVVAILLGK